MSFLVVMIKTIKDPSALEEYLSKVTPMVARYGGCYVAADSNPDLKAGQWNYVRTVLINFQSFGVLTGWYDSPEYQDIVPLRNRAFDADIICVHGLTDK